MLFRSPECHKRSLAKAISWRITGSLDTFVLTYLITGNLVFAGSVASAESVTKIVLYYFHERIWSMVDWGRTGTRTFSFRDPRAHAGATLSDQVG